MNHDHGMGGMAPAPPQSTNGTSGMPHHNMMMMMMHMTFFWGNNAEILFSGWPGARAGMYALALIFIFVLAFLVEWLSHSNFLFKRGSSNNNVSAGLLQTLLHAMRVGLAYLVMLAVMSFNGGVFLMAVAGHALGFMLFGSRMFRKNTDMLSYEKTSDLPPMSC